MREVNLSNFQEGQIWITKKRDKYRIVSVERDNPVCWYPILLENTKTKILYTADAKGFIYDNFRSLDDKLTMQVDEDFNLSDGEKDLATRMLKVYNKRKETMEAERKKKNESIKRSWRLIKKPKR